MAKKPFPFEKSKFDNDKGVKEGSKADKKRDAKEKLAMRVADKGKVKIAAAKPAFLKGKK